MKPGDLLVYFDQDFNCNRVWQVRSVCLGASGQESLIELKNLSEKPGRGTDQREHRTTWVPEPLLRHVCLYTQVVEERKRATISELARLIESDENPPIVVRRDGSITTGA